ncbi:MAG: transposase, partial [Candidatus Aenigmarchaeota archaeon]|nr:transposase [Candidatus Aenigmarchaeota archaeon]
IKKLNWKDILEIFQEMIRKNYLDVRRMYRITGKAKLAIDFHDIPYYGKDDDLFITRGKPKSGTNKFLKIISIDIVERGRRFTLSIIPMNTFKSKRKVIKDLLNHIKGLVRIDCVLMDRGFQSIDVYKLFNKRKKNWITPVKKTAKIMSIMDECAKKNVWKTIYRLQCNRNYIDVRLLIYPTEDGDLVGFFTNMDVEPDWVARTYPQRWGIETGYRVKKEFRAKTCSTSFTVRLLFILVSVVLYNFWILLNVENHILGEKTITVRKVRITFRRILEQGIT